ncbi:S8 family serine peptidase [Neobacillus sp. PS2-9]|uniref:S8 family serine peptidase n=1 Tax=Neobacillus sp. PS2-9 TaxID=3070676 RepID=UPI0027E10F05|nr:S8 family serine peptidase [Neobacillus sp. PS2-9]WML58945.1 S8 family serine peptidase [Neobacillus sp. PS2-9]
MKPSKWLFPALSMLLFSSTALTTNAFATENKNEVKTPIIQKNPASYQAGELIIKYKNTNAAASFKKKHPFKTKKKLHSIGAEIVKVDYGTNIDSLINKLQTDPSVAYVQPNYKYTITALPNDPEFSKLWGLHNTGQAVNGTSGSNDIDIDYPEAIQEFTNSDNQQQVVVGVIDTGIDLNHPDLKDNIWTNPGEIAGNGIDDDHNGYIDDVHGWDFYHNDASIFDAEDGDDHGTHVAGTIAAKANNGIGITGIAPNVKIMPLKFIGPDGNGNTADAILAVEYASKMGVRVTNNSWAGLEYDQALKDAIDKSSLLFVAAAGNEGVNNDQVPSYPANYDTPKVISVAAIDSSGNLADFSNFGVNSVDIAAPGTGIFSTVPRKKEEGAAAQIYNSTFNYKAIFNGFGFENLSSTDRQSAFNKAVSYLGLTSSSKILLVQDDESTSGGASFADVYKNLLKNAGLSYTLKTVATGENGPNFPTLSGYDSVIWFTGNAIGDVPPNLTSTDLTSLERFLKKGNKTLMLSGQDILYQNEDSSFVTDTLSLTIKGEGETSVRVTGVERTAYEGASYSIDYAPYADYITSNNEAMAKVNLIFPEETSYATAYAFGDGTSMAAPHVSGVAALLAGKYPNAGPEKLRSIILASGDSLSNLAGKVQSGKTVNAWKALTYNSKPVVSEVSNKDTMVTGKAEAGTTVEVKVNGAVVGSDVSDTDGRFAVAIPAQDAGVELVITATDNTGLVSEAALVVVNGSAADQPDINIVPVNGWVYANNHWYYFDGKGNLVTGWQHIGGKWYYFDEDNVMKTGWLKLGPTWYFLDSSGAMKTGWLKSRASWYYLNGSGAMETGWVKVGTSWYYFYLDGRMAFNITIQGYNLSSSGAWVK